MTIGLGAIAKGIRLGAGDLAAQEDAEQLKREREQRYRHNESAEGRAVSGERRAGIQFDSSQRAVDQTYRHRESGEGRAAEAGIRAEEAHDTSQEAAELKKQADTQALEVARAEERVASLEREIREAMASTQLETLDDTAQYDAILAVHQKQDEVKKLMFQVAKVDGPRAAQIWNMQAGTPNTNAADVVMHEDANGIRWMMVVDASGEPVVDEAYGPQVFRLDDLEEAYGGDWEQIKSGSPGLVKPGTGEVQMHDFGGTDGSAPPAVVKEADAIFRRKKALNPNANEDSLWLEAYGEAAASNATSPQEAIASFYSMVFKALTKDMDPETEPAAMDAARARAQEETQFFQDEYYSEQPQQPGIDPGAALEPDLSALPEGFSVATPP